jgi:hypothetical protein
LPKLDGYRPALNMVSSTKHFFFPTGALRKLGILQGYQINEACLRLAEGEYLP